MYKCKKCDYEIDNVSELANHYQYKHKIINKVNCPKCKKEFINEKGLKCHTKESCEKINKKKSINHICPKCNNYINHSIKNHIDSCGEIKERFGYGRNWSLGKTFDGLYGLEKSRKIKEKISNKLTGFKFPDRKINPETEKIRKEKLSIIAKRNGLGGYKKGSGRGKSGWYKGYWCDSSWELAFVIYNLEHNIKFERNNEKFEYLHNGKILKYIPDFKINSIYIEIKGYFTSQTYDKINQFKYDLKIYDKDGIKPYLEYVKNTYGNGFISLYNKNDKIDKIEN